MLPAALLSHTFSTKKTTLTHLKTNTVAVPKYCCYRCAQQRKIMLPAALLSHTFSKTTLTHLKTNTVVQ
jgi:hypothetical protein